MGQVGQLPQVPNQARPAPFADPDDRDARIVYVVQFVVAVGVKARRAGGRQGPRGSLADNRDFPQGIGAGLYHLARLPEGVGRLRGSGISEPVAGVTGYHSLEPMAHCRGRLQKLNVKSAPAKLSRRPA